MTKQTLNYVLYEVKSERSWEEENLLYPSFFPLTSPHLFTLREACAALWEIVLGDYQCMCVLLFACVCVWITNVWYLFPELQKALFDFLAAGGPASITCPCVCVCVESAVMFVCLHMSLCLSTCNMCLCVLSFVSVGSCMCVCVCMHA